ncbi:MAG: hypothetical protein V4557_11275 [Bacteroidota bacterium]
MRHFFISLVIVILCKGAFAQLANKNKAEIVIDKGILRGNNYSNRYFNFDVLIPKAWTVINKKDLLDGFTVQKEILKSERGQTEAEFNKNGDKFFVLLTASPNAQTRMPLIMFFTLDLDLDLAHFSETDYLKNYQNTLTKSYKTLDVTFNFSQIITEKVQGKSFYSFTTTITRNGLSNYQKVYSTIYRNKFLNIFLNYENNKENTKGLEFLKKISWK